MLSTQWCTTSCGAQAGLHAASGVLQPDALPFEGLELGPLVGRGSFGRVYRGRWQDKTVAVKVRARRTTQHDWGQHF